MICISLSIYPCSFLLLVTPRSSESDAEACVIGAPSVQKPSTSGFVIHQQGNTSLLICDIHARVAGLSFQHLSMLCPFLLLIQKKRTKRKGYHECNTAFASSHKLTRARAFLSTGLSSVTPFVDTLLTQNKLFLSSAQARQNRGGRGSHALGRYFAYTFLVLFVSMTKSTEKRASSFYILLALFSILSKTFLMSPLVFLLIFLKISCMVILEISRKSPCNLNRLKSVFSLLCTSRLRSK